jgi:hypothetical protein
MPAEAMDTYRRNAEECRDQADLSIRSEHKTHWLRLADAWFKLAENQEGSGDHSKPPSGGLDNRE